MKAKLALFEKTTVYWDGKRATSPDPLIQEALDAAASIPLPAAFPTRRRHETLGEHGVRVLWEWFSVTALILEDADVEESRKGCLDTDTE